MRPATDPVPPSGTAVNSGLSAAGSFDPRLWVLVADEIRDQITGHQLRPAQPLTSPVELARRHGVSPDTVDRACRHLADEGLLQFTPGRGYRVAVSFTYIIP